jgi:hypothetical protein
MRQVAIRGFFTEAGQTAPSSPVTGPNEYQSVSVNVQLPEDMGDLDCAWLMEAANTEFKKAGVNMRLVGLLGSASTDIEHPTMSSTGQPLHG